MWPAIIRICRCIIRYVWCFGWSSSQSILWFLQHCCRHLSVFSIFIWIGVVASVVIRAVWVSSAELIIWVYHTLVFHASKRVARVHLAIRLWLLVLSVVFVYYLLLLLFEFFIRFVADVLKGCFTSGYAFIRMRYFTVRQISIHFWIVRHQTRFLLIPNIDLVGALPKVEKVLIFDVWFHFCIKLLWSGVSS